jgi:pantoate--beta-alanine ligase
MIECSTAAQLRDEIAARRARGSRIGFVPTMGNLHVGHRRLMEEARQRADVVVVSIYVNPLQFGPKEDFAAYPRTPMEDRALLQDARVDLLFAPEEREMYPRGREQQTQVEVPELSDILCGAFRPGHFRGVTTVVARLFGLVKPDIAVFGKKDFQQLLIIRRMTADIGLPIEIVGVDTVRESDGLAVSSRNRYLSAEERGKAPQLHAVLQRVAQALAQGTSAAVAEEAAANELRTAGFRPDYVSVRRRSDLAAPDASAKSLVVLTAAWLGRTRLIDNLEFERATV